LIGPEGEDTRPEVVGDGEKKKGYLTNGKGSHSSDGEFDPGWVYQERVGDARKQFGKRGIQGLKNAFTGGKKDMEAAKGGFRPFETGNGGQGRKELLAPILFLGKEGRGGERTRVNPVAKREKKSPRERERKWAGGTGEASPWEREMTRKGGFDTERFLAGACEKSGEKREDEAHISFTSNKDRRRGEVPERRSGAHGAAQGNAGTDKTEFSLLDKSKEVRN